MRFMKFMPHKQRGYILPALVMISGLAAMVLLWGMLRAHLVAQIAKTVGGEVKIQAFERKALQVVLTQITLQNDFSQLMRRLNNVCSVTHEKWGWTCMHKITIAGMSRSVQVTIKFLHWVAAAPTCESKGRAVFALTAQLPEVGLASRPLQVIWWQYYANNPFPCIKAVNPSYLGVPLDAVPWHSSFGDLVGLFAVSGQHLLFQGANESAWQSFSLPTSFSALKLSPLRLAWSTDPGAVLVIILGRHHILGILYHTNFHLLWEWALPAQVILRNATVIDDRLLWLGENHARQGVLGWLTLASGQASDLPAAKKEYILPGMLKDDQIKLMLTDANHWQLDVAHHLVILPALQARSGLLATRLETVVR